jgi:purine-binding chemotaxis protein CheW
VSVLHVVFRVGDADYIVAAADVLQMESFTGATRVPGTLEYVSGVVQVRGRVVPVVDLRPRFGLERVAPTIDTRVIVVQMMERTVGLVVDSAREVVKLGPEQLQPPPRVVASHAEGFVKAVAHLGERLLMLIDFMKVIGEDSIHVN